MAFTRKASELILFDVVSDVRQRRAPRFFRIVFALRACGLGALLEPSNQPRRYACTREGSWRFLSQGSAFESVYRGGRVVLTTK